MTSLQAHKAALAGHRRDDLDTWSHQRRCGRRPSRVEHFSEAQQVELVLDITRNAINKVAVALAADAPHVEHGIEIYDVDDTGNLVYGLSLD